MITADDFTRFVALRTRLFDAIDRQYAAGSHGKSYEGAFELHIPGHGHGHERGDEMALASTCLIILHCYVIGPNRHYQWRGVELSDALDLAEHDVDAWIAESDQEAAS